MGLEQPGGSGGIAIGDELATLRGETKEFGRVPRECRQGAPNRFDLPANPRNCGIVRLDAGTRQQARQGKNRDHHHHGGGCPSTSVWPGWTRSTRHMSHPCAVRIQDSRWTAEVRISWSVLSGKRCCRTVVWATIACAVSPVRTRSVILSDSESNRSTRPMKERVRSYICSRLESWPCALIVWKSGCLRRMTRSGS